MPSLLILYINYFYGICCLNVPFLKTLDKYNIDKTPSQIIKEYYENKGESLSHHEIQKLEKNYRKNEPEQFLAMYDAIRDNDKTNEK